MRNRKKNRKRRRFNRLKFKKYGSWFKLKFWRRMRFYKIFHFLRIIIVFSDHVSGGNCCVLI